MARATRTRGASEMSDTDPSLMEAMDNEATERLLPDPTALPEEDLMLFMESALPQLSIENLGQIGDAVRQIRQTELEEARQTTRQAIEALLQATGLSLRDLFPELLPGRRSGEPILPKFRGPNGEEWSGRGHTPRWLTALEATGRSRDEFRIREETSHTLEGSISAATIEDL